MISERPLQNISVSVWADELADLRLLAERNDDRAVSYLICQAVSTYLASRKEELEDLKKRLFITPELIPDPNPPVRDREKES